MRRPPSSRNRLLLEGLQGAGQGGRQAEACHPGQPACRLARARGLPGPDPAHSQGSGCRGGALSLEERLLCPWIFAPPGRPHPPKVHKGLQDAHSGGHQGEVRRLAVLQQRKQSGHQRGVGQRGGACSARSTGGQAAQSGGQSTSDGTGQGRVEGQGGRLLRQNNKQPGPGGTVPTAACPAPTCRGRDQSAQHGQQRLNERLRVAVGYRLAACTRSRTSRFRQVWRPWRARARTHVITGSGRDADKRRVHHRQGEKGKNARRLPSPPALPACPAYSPAHPSARPRPDGSSAPAARSARRPPWPQSLRCAATGPAAAQRKTEHGRRDRPSRGFFV